MLTDKGVLKETGSIRILKSLLGSQADTFHFMEEEDHVFFLPKGVLEGERLKAVHALAAELGGKWSGWNVGFMVPVASLMNRAPKEVEKNVVEKIAYATEWYDNLVSDCCKIIEAQNIEIIRRNHQIGKRIITDILRFEKAEYGNKTVANVAADIGVSKTTLYAYLKFVKTYPDFDAFLRKFSNALENLSWRYISNELLVEKIETDERQKPADVLEKMKLYYPFEIIDQLNSYVTKETSRKKLRNIFKLFIKIMWQLVCEYEEIKRVVLSRFEENIKT